MNLQRLKEKYANNKAIPIHDMKDSFLVEDIMALLAYIESLEKKVKAGEFLARRMDNFTPTLYPIMDAKGESNLVYVNDALTRWHKTVSEMLDDYRKQVE